jgi:hypothetical protein
MVVLLVKRLHIINSLCRKVKHFDSKIDFITVQYYLKSIEAEKVYRDIFWHLRWVMY